MDKLCVAPGPGQPGGKEEEMEKPRYQHNMEDNILKCDGCGDEIHPFVHGFAIYPDGRRLCIGCAISEETLGKKP